MGRLKITWFIITLLILAPAAPAAGPAGDPHTPERDNHAEEAPNIFSGDIFTALFTLAVFIVILIILGKWAWGPILDGLQKREAHIRNSIEEAEKAKADSEKALEAYKEQLARANQEAQGIIDKGRADAVQLAEQMKQTAQEEARSLRAQTERDIASAKDQALKEIYQQTTELATQMAAGIIGKTLNADDHRNLLQESLNKLQQNSSKDKV
jgi:F-type H+-transporting ATPase subunit b